MAEEEAVFSEGEFDFRRQVERFVRAVEQQEPEERLKYFQKAAKALSQMAPNPPIIPIGTGPSTTPTQGTCPKCKYVFSMT